MFVQRQPALTARVAITGMKRISGTAAVGDGKEGARSCGSADRPYRPPTEGSSRVIEELRRLPAIKSCRDGTTWIHQRRVCAVPSKTCPGVAECPPAINGGRGRSDTRTIKTEQVGNSSDVEAERA